MSGSLPLETFWARQDLMETSGKPRDRLQNYTSHLSWEHLGIPQGRACRWEKDEWTAPLALPAP